MIDVHLYYWKLALWRIIQTNEHFQIDWEIDVIFEAFFALNTYYLQSTKNKKERQQNCGINKLDIKQVFKPRRDFKNEPS